MLIRPGRASPLAASSVSYRRTADFNLVERVLGKMYERQGKDDSRNVDEAGDKIGAAAIVPP